MEKKPLTDITEDELREAIKHFWANGHFTDMQDLLCQLTDRIRERREVNLVGVGDVIECRGSHPEDQVVGVVIKVMPGAGTTGKDLLDYIVADPGCHNPFHERWDKRRRNGCTEFHTPDGRRGTGVRVEDTP